MTDENDITSDQKLRLSETERWWDVYKSSATFTKEYGIATVRSLILINGAATVALLATLSHVLTEDSQLAKKLAEGLSFSFAFFLIGLVFAVITGALGYYNFFFVGAGLPGPNELHRYLKAGDISGWKPRKVLVPLTMYAASVTAILSLISFAGGSIFALCAFRSL